MITKCVEYNIICDICGVDGCNCRKADWHPDGFHAKDWDYMIPLSERGHRQVRKWAKQSGWVYSGGKDICPNCQVNKKTKG